MDTIFYKKKALLLHKFVDGIYLLRGKQLDNQLLPSLGQLIQNNQPNGILDVIATETELCLFTDKTKDVQLQVILNQLETKAIRINTHTVRLDFNKSLDLAYVSKETNISETSIIDILCSSSFTIGMFGFLPGFFYLNGLTPQLHIARRPKPRPRVPQGSFAIGGPYAGIYPSNSPGGWHILGQCDEDFVEQMEARKFNIGDQLIIQAK